MSVFQEILFNEKFDELNNMVRWNGMNRIKDETVAHHSFLVTWFSRILAEGIYPSTDLKTKLAITTYAAFHDFDEMFTGDINHNLKYNKYNGREIRKEIGEYVDKAVDDFFVGDGCIAKMFRDNLHMKNREVKLIVKIADWLSMGFYIKKEIELGNRILIPKYKYCIDKLNSAVNEAIEHLEGTMDIRLDLRMLEEIKTINWIYND